MRRCISALISSLMWLSLPGASLRGPLAAGNQTAGEGAGRQAGRQLDAVAEEGGGRQVRQEDELGVGGGGWGRRG